VSQLSELQHRAQNCLARRTERCRERLELTACRWPGAQALFLPKSQRVDELSERLPRSLASRAAGARGDLNLVAGRLRSELLAQRISRLAERLSAAWKMAELAHPERPLSKGYVRVTSRDGRTLTHAADARAASLLTLNFGDGAVDAAVEGNTERRMPVERKPRRAHIPGQPGLFDVPEE
jgi:exodeoxyribonuclease VII large subunit